MKKAFAIILAAAMVLSLAACDGDKNPDASKASLGAESTVSSKGSTSSGEIVKTDPSIPTINAKDYGAVGDGKTDDTEAINAAIKAAQKKGGTVFIPAGTYMVSTPVELKKEVSLIGVPKSDGTAGGDTIIKAMGSEIKSVISTAKSSCQDVILRNITFDGGKEDGLELDCVLDMATFSGSTFSNLLVTNCTGMGIFTYSGDNKTPTWIGFYENIDVRNVDGYAFYTIQSDTQFNHLRVYGSKGIMDYMYGGNTYNDVLVDGSTDAGITIGRPSTEEGGCISLYRSTFKNCAGYGVHMETVKPNSKQVSISYCDFENNKADIYMLNVNTISAYMNNFKSELAFETEDKLTKFEFVNNVCAKQYYSFDEYFDKSSKDVGNKIAASDSDYLTGVGIETEDETAYKNYKTVNEIMGFAYKGKLINVQDEGILPDKKIEEGALQKVIDSLGSEGGVLYFPEGNYGFPEMINVPSNVYFYGENYSKTTIKVKAKDSVDAMFNIDNAENIGFINIRLSNNLGYKIKDLISVKNSKNVFFDCTRIDALKNSEYMISAENSSGVAVNTVIMGSEQDVSGIRLINCTDSIIQSNYISNGLRGISVEGGSNNIIFNNHLDWWTNEAIYVTSDKTEPMNLLIANNYTDVNYKHVYAFDFPKPFDAKCTVIGGIIRQTGTDGNGGDKTECELYFKNAKGITVAASNMVGTNNVESTGDNEVTLIANLNEKFFKEKAEDPTQFTLIGNSYDR